MLEARFFGLPKEPRSIFEEAHIGAILLPRRLLLLDDHARLTRLRIGREHVQDILSPRRARIQQLAAIGRPSHVEEVVLGRMRQRARRFAQRVDLNGLTAFKVVDKQRSRWIWLPRFRISLTDDARTRFGPTAEDVEVLDLRFIEAIEREAL